MERSAMERNLSFLVFVSHSEHVGELCSTWDGMAII